MTELIDKTQHYVASLLKMEASGHDWWHTQRVTQMALRLAKVETQSINTEVIVLAALLHDVEDYKSSGSEEAGPQAAARWLTICDANPKLIKQVVLIISTMSFKGQVDRPMATKEGMIVQDADRLDAVGAIGIARVFAFGGAHHREIFNPEIPFEVNLSPNDYKDKTRPTTSLNHFYEKLLKLDMHYNMALANEIGHQRHLFMLAYVSQFLNDCEAQDSEYARYLNLD